MAAELDYNEENGNAAFFGRQPAWHGEGIVIDSDRHISVEEALELASLNWKVATVPLFTATTMVLGDGAEPHAATAEDEAIIDQLDTFKSYQQIDSYRATMRLDRREVLGVVGKQYTPLQNRDAFNVLTPLIDEGIARIETAGALRRGRDVWMLTRFKIEDERVNEVLSRKGQQVIPYGLITNNHSGQRKVNLQETPIKVVCANTLAMARVNFGELVANEQAFEVRHTTNVEASVVEAAKQLFGGFVKRYHRIAEQYDAMMRTYLDEALFRELVLDVVAPIPSKLDKSDLTKRETTSRERIEELRSRVQQLWTEGDGHRGDRSAWEAYNAVTQSVDHDRELWKVRSDLRLAALFDGRLADVKQGALDSLVGYCKENPEVWESNQYIEV